MFRIVRNAGLVALPMAVISICAFAQAADPPASGGRANFALRAIQKMDTNGDGRVSLDEYLAAATVHFKSLDSQNKGSIDAADLASSKMALMRIDHRANALVKRLDTAGNGYVTQDEFVAAAQKRFARLDKNGDGKLTPDELGSRGRHGADSSTGAAPGKGAQAVSKRFAAIDTNHDGVVTLDEYVAAAQARFVKLDLQHNGKVTASEIASSPATQERALRMANRFVERMDANGDGVVSQDEFLAAAKARFAKIDKNGDGFIDADEMAGQRWAGKGHGHPG